MEEEAWQGGETECTASELAQLMYWLLMTGFSLRQLEQRCDLTRTLDLAPPPPPQQQGGLEGGWNGGHDPPSLPPGRPRR